MYALDFEYDGQYLSDFGFIICNFGDASNMDIVSAGSKITFNTVQKHAGKKYSLTGTRYDECIQVTFDICKNPDLYNDLYITSDEFRSIMRWLNRRRFLKCHFIDEECSSYESCYYDASFNVEKIVVDKNLYGIRLTMETNKPFGYGQERTFIWNIADVSDVKNIYDTSDEIGYIYPSMKITVNQSGDFSIYNELEGCTMAIKNCSKDEVITIDGETHIISSSIPSHKLYNDFNFDFFRIGNTLLNKENKIQVSLPCRLEIRYSPIIKNAPC